MPKPSSKTPAKKQPPKDTRQLARSKIDAVAPAAEPTKPAANKAKPPKPVKKQDVKDIDRADDEGMGQPQGISPQKKPAAVAKKAATRR